jgi:hypothetical protein
MALISFCSNAAQEECGDNSSGSSSVYSTNSKQPSRQRQLKEEEEEELAQEPSSDKTSSSIDKKEFMEQYHQTRRAACHELLCQLSASPDFSTSVPPAFRRSASAPCSTRTSPTVSIHQKQLHHQVLVDSAVATIVHVASSVQVDPSLSLSLLSPIQRSLSARRESLKCIRNQGHNLDILKQAAAKAQRKLNFRAAQKIQALWRASHCRSSSINRQRLERGFPPHNQNTNTYANNVISTRIQTESQHSELTMSELDPSTHHERSMAVSVFHRRHRGTRPDYNSETSGLTMSSDDLNTDTFHERSTMGDTCTSGNSNSSHHQRRLSKIRGSRPGYERAPSELTMSSDDLNTDTFHERSSISTYGDYDYSFASTTGDIIPNTKRNDNDEHEHEQNFQDSMASMNWSFLLNVHGSTTLHEGSEEANPSNGSSSGAIDSLHFSNSDNKWASSSPGLVSSTPAMSLSLLGIDLEDSIGDTAISDNNDDGDDGEVGFEEQRPPLQRMDKAAILPFQQLSLDTYAHTSSSPSPETFTKKQQHRLLRKQRIDSVRLQEFHNDTTSPSSVTELVLLVTAEPAPSLAEAEDRFRALPPSKPMPKQSSPTLIGDRALEAQQQQEQQQQRHVELIIQAAVKANTT